MSNENTQNSVLSALIDAIGRLERTTRDHSASIVMVLNQIQDLRCEINELREMIDNINIDEFQPLEEDVEPIDE